MSDSSKTKQELLGELKDLQQQLESSRRDASDLAARNERLEALCSVMQGLSAGLDLEALTEAFRMVVARRVPFDVFSLNLQTGERQFEHLATGEVVAAPGPIGQAGSATDWVIQNREPLIRQDIAADSRFRVNDRTKASGIRSDALLPLIARDEVIGTLTVASYSAGAYGEADLEFLVPLAKMAAIFVDDGRLLRDLKAAYRDLKLVYDGVSDLIFLLRVVDGKPGPVVSVNRALLQATGLEESEVIGRALADVVAGSSAVDLERRCQQAVDEDRPVSFEGTVSLPTGELTVDGIVTSIEDEVGVCGHVLGVARNITDRKQTERELIRLERLHALEEMARGVAHNFNNILVGVLGYAQLIEMQSRDQAAVDSARHIVESALRAKDLVQRLNLSVGRGSESPPQRVDTLEDIVGEAVEATRPKWQDEMQVQGVTVKVDASIDAVPPVKANPAGLHHILVNLISNAVDAMPEGGNIGITAASTGDWVRLEVADTGSGMSEAIQRRIFEPFFTTRQDVGSGLGLAMTYRTVTEWGGDVEVVSEPGRGTTFTVVLPLWEDDPGPGEAAPTKKGRILVVDDEWTVRQVLQRALKDYHLEVYSRGSDALDRLEASAFDLALIDLGLPGVPGNELAERAKQENPETITVLITGWEVPEDDARLAHFDYHVRKPFGLAEIRDLVERALGHKGKA